MTGRWAARTVWRTDRGRRKKAMKMETALHGAKRLMLHRQLAASVNVTLLTVRHLGTCRKKYSDMPLEDDHNLNS